MRMVASSGDDEAPVPAPPDAQPARSRAAATTADAAVRDLFMGDSPGCCECGGSRRVDVEAVAEHDGLLAGADRQGEPVRDGRQGAVVLRREAAGRHEGAVEIEDDVA